MDYTTKVGLYQDFMVQINLKKYREKINFKYSIRAKWKQADIKIHQDINIYVVN